MKTAILKLEWEKIENEILLFALVCFLFLSCVSELQASVDGLLAEKLKLEQQVEDLTSEQTQLREQVM